MASSVDYTWPNPRNRDSPNLQCCHVGPVNYVLAHLVGACSLPWHKAVGPVQRRSKCLCHIRDKRGVFAWTMALAMKLGKGKVLLLCCNDLVHICIYAYSNSIINSSI